MAIGNILSICYLQLLWLLEAKKMLSRMDHGLEVTSMSKQTKMLMAQYYWFSFSTDWQHYGLLSEVDCLR